MKYLLLFVLLFPLVVCGQDCDSIVSKDSLKFEWTAKHILKGQRNVSVIENDSFSTRLWLEGDNGNIYLLGAHINKIRKIDTAKGLQEVTIICGRLLQHFELCFDSGHRLMCTSFYDDNVRLADMSFLLKGKAYINSRKLIGKNRPANIQKGDSVLAKQLCTSLVKQINCFDVHFYIVDSKKMDTINKKAYTIDVPATEARKLQLAAQCLLNQ